MRQLPTAAGRFRAAALAHYRGRQVEPAERAGDDDVPLRRPTLLFLASVMLLLAASMAPVRCAVHARVIAHGSRSVDVALESPRLAALARRATRIGSGDGRCRWRAAAAPRSPRPTLRLDGTCTAPGDELTLELETSLWRLVTPRLPGRS